MTSSASPTASLRSVPGILTQCNVYHEVTKQHCDREIISVHSSLYVRCYALKSNCLILALRGINDNNNNRGNT